MYWFDLLIIILLFYLYCLCSFVSSDSGLGLDAECTFNSTSYQDNTNNLLGSLLQIYHNYESQNNIPIPSNAYCQKGYQCVFSTFINSGVKFPKIVEQCTYCDSFPASCTSVVHNKCGVDTVRNAILNYALTHASLFKPQCKECGAGTYCPAGTDNPYGFSTLNLCPSGFFCTFPGVKELCTRGSYCPSGTKYQIPCNLPGTFCDFGSSVNYYKCPAGYFCKSPTVKEECPDGYRCPPGSIEPTSCGTLAYCPAGTAYPNVQFTGFIVLFVLLIVTWAIMHFSNRYIKKKATEEAIKRETDMKKTELLKKLKDIANTIKDRNNVKIETERGFEISDTPISIGFNNLSLTLNVTNKVVLNGVTGEFQSGKLIAIMGPSGAGKTTFLNALLGKAAVYGKIGGNVTINNIPGLKLSTLKSCIGYVPQDDILHEDLTVYENLYFNALLRLPSSYPLSQKLSIIEQVLNMLGISAIRNSVVGSVESRGISGGQKKRVNIALELVSSPKIIFMDEPTSGLDSTAALEVLSSLRDLCVNYNITIICVIHQPRFAVFTQFHQVLLLGVGGTTVYLGESHLALQYFESLGFILPKDENPADFFLDVIAGEIKRNGYPDFKPNHLFDLWEKYKLKSLDSNNNQNNNTTGTIAKLNDSSASRQPNNGSIQGQQQSNNHVRFQDEEDDNGVLASNSPIRRRTEYKYPAALSVMSLPKHLLMLDELINDHKYDINADFQSPTMGPLQVNPMFDIQNMINLLANDVNQNPNINENERISTSTRTTNTSSNSDNNTRSSNSNIDVELKEIPQLNHSSHYTTHNNFSSSMESGKYPTIPNRPGFLTQLWIFSIRSARKFYRNLNKTVFDLLFLIILGVSIGIIYGSDWEIDRYGSIATMSSLALAVVASVSSLRFFGSDRIIFWRESSAGIHIQSYGLAVLLFDIPRIIVYPIVFLLVYYYLLLPRSLYGDMYEVYIFVFWVGSGYGLLFSVLFPPLTSLLISVIFPLILGFLSGISPHLSTMTSSTKALYGLSYVRWSTEGLNILELNSLPSYQQNMAQNIYSQIGWDKDNLSLDLGILFIMGLLLRLLTLLALQFMFKAKRV